MAAARPLQRPSDQAPLLTSYTRPVPTFDGENRKNPSLGGDIRGSGIAVGETATKGPPISSTGRLSGTRAADPSGYTSFGIRARVGGVYRTILATRWANCNCPHHVLNSRLVSPEADETSDNSFLDEAE